MATPHAIDTHTRPLSPHLNRQRAEASAGVGRSSSPFDGLAVAVSTVPLVLSGVFLLAELNRVKGGGGDGAEGMGGGATPEELEASLSDSYGDDSNNSISGVAATAIAAAAGAACTNGEELAAYLEVMLESSILCAVWEVSESCLTLPYPGGESRRSLGG